MHRLSPLATSLACALFAGIAFAQQPVPRTAAGELPGTERWNVVFERRSFDLSEFSAAIRGNASVEAVDAIVAGLQRSAIEDQRGFKEEVESLGGRVLIQFWLINAATIEIAPDKVALLRRMPNVLDVSPDLVVEPLAPIKVATDAGHHNADAEQAAGNKGTGYATAIIDTGQDSNYAGQVNRPHRIYYRNGDRNNHTASGIDGSRLLANVKLAAQPADDTHNHGTGVAGIAAGEIWGTATSDRGHANDANIVGYSICEFAGSCSSTLAIEALGFQTAAADKVRYNIVSANMSYGSSPTPTDVSQMAIDAAAKDADIVCVTAAGNSSSSTAGSSSTANGLAVAACQNSKVMATFSSRGPLSGDTLRFFPDITANGVSTVMPQRDNDATDWVASGTSMASPQVCGAATLIKAARPCLNACDIKALLLACTESIAAQNPAAPYNNRNSYGMGYLRDDLTANAARAPGSVISDSINSTTTPDTHTIVVTAGQQVSVALVWFRHVLTSTAWSNLGLRVLNGATVVAQNNDPRNLYEVVRFTAPITGTLTVEVSASSLEIANLPYSLAFRNAAASNTATFSTFGAGCVGTHGQIPSLAFTGVPRLGDNYTVNLRRGPANAQGVLFIGFSNTHWGGAPILPFDMTIINAPGCRVYCSDNIVLTANANAGGSHDRVLAVPCDKNFLGLAVYYEWLLFNAVNPLGLITSNAGQGNVGW